MQKNSARKKTLSLSFQTAIVEYSEDAILSKTTSGVITSWNPAAEKIFGYTKKEAIGRPMSLIIPPELYDEEEMILQHISKGKRFKNYETIRLRKDGKRIYAAVTISPIKNAEGEVIGASTIAHDITRHKETEQKLRESEERYRLLFEHATDLVTVVDTKGKYVFVSPSHLQMLGYVPEELIGKNVFTLLHQDDIARAKKEFAKGLQGKIGHAVVRFKHKNGTWRTLESTGSSILDELRRPTMVIVMSHDITERIRMEKRKDEFISIASHELKTPLTSIKVFAQLMQRHNQEKKDMKMLMYLAKMEQQIDKLNKLIQDLLDISKIQAGKMLFQMEIISLKDIVREIVDMMQTTTITHKLVIDGTSTALVQGDRDRLGQVLVNFISNALKYSPKAKRIIIHIREEKNRVIVGVEDFGIGIPREHLERVFERFYRVEGKSEKTFPGFGIGLYIASGIIKRHKGDVWVESKERKGSTFSFSLPIVAPKHATGKKRAQKQVLP